MLLGGSVPLHIHGPEKPPTFHPARKVSATATLTSAKQQNNQTINQETRTSRFRDIETSRRPVVKTSGRQSVLTPISQSLFEGASLSGPSILADFVPEVGFGNEWFASAQAGKQAGTGRDIRPVFEPRNIVCSGLSKLCFPLLEIFSVTQNDSPARGRKTTPKSSFFTGPCVPRPIFRRP